MEGPSGLGAHEVPAAEDVLFVVVDFRESLGLDPREGDAPGSGEQRKNRWSNLERLRPTDEIKLVLADEADYVWARALGQPIERPKSLTTKMLEDVVTKAGQGV